MAALSGTSDRYLPRAAHGPPEPRRHNPRPRRSKAFVHPCALGLLVAVSVLGSGCGGGAATADREIVVMAAASLAEVMETVAQDRPNVTPVIAGSSTLVSQLQAGAPADMLITADGATMARAVADGTVQGEPVVIAANDLVLAAAPSNPGAVTSLADLSRRDLLVGLCAEEVPCGTLARRALDEAGVVASADTLELNVRALTTKLSLGELDAGLIYRTDAAAAGLPAIETPELARHSNRYHIASVSAEPTPGARALIDSFAEPGGTGAEALRSHGFGAPR